MKILLVNDDGIYAPGILALAHELKKDHEIVLIAPEKQMSGTSHCITFYGFINYCELDIIEGVKSYILRGTPADCTKFGIDTILKREHPDLVISGINKGYNIGTDVVYSGTVNAALEGSILNVKSIAVSQDYYLDDFSYSAKFIAKNLDKLYSMIPKDASSVLNINIPDEKILKGTKITKVGQIRYNDEYIYVENRGYYITGDPIKGYDKSLDTDVKFIHEGYITISFVKNEFNDLENYEKNKDIEI